MKITKILSALLSATLALSSLPLMASNGADNDTESGANLFGDVKPTVANGSVVAKADAAMTGDYYLRVSNRSDRDHTFSFAIDSAPADGTYYISFDARQSYDTKTVGSLTKGKDNYDGAVDLRAKSAKVSDTSAIYWIPTNNCTEDAKTSNYTTTDLTSSSTYFRIYPTWKHYEFEHINVKEGDPVKFIVWGSTSIRYEHGFDIDNFKIWYVDGDGAHPLNGDNGYTFEADNGEDKLFKATYGSTKATRTKAESYHRTELTSGDDMTVVYTFGENGEGVEIESGVYQLGGDIRLGCFLADVFSDHDGPKWSNNASAFNDGAQFTGTFNGVSYTKKPDCLIYTNSVGVTITVFVGEDGEYELASFDAVNDWRDIEAELLAVPETGLLKKIEIAITKKTSDLIDGTIFPATPNLPVDIKNMSLTKKADSTAELGKAEDNLLSGTTVSSAGEITTTESYLYVPERPTSVSDFVTFTVADKVRADTYYVSFDARVSADSKKASTNIRVQLPNGSKITIEEAKANGWSDSGIKDAAMNGQYVVPLFGDDFTMGFVKWDTASNG